MSALKRTHIEASNKARKDLDHIHHHLKVNNYRYYSLFSMRVLHILAKKSATSDYLLNFRVVYTANVYRQTTDELMFKSVLSTQR